MSPKGLEVLELGAGYYTSPIEQVRAVIQAYETAGIYGIERFRNIFSVEIDVRVLMAIMQQTVENT
ncbi:MAG: hypothetical protein P4N41_00060 [Negativicutes bacterium]|nr:hypothetical protein [Negativicutes bacterium]